MITRSLFGSQILVHVFVVVLAAQGSAQSFGKAQGGMNTAPDHTSGDPQAGPPGPGDGSGTVLAHQKISYDDGGLAGAMPFDDLFGFDLTSLGDFDGDGIGDLAVAARGLGSNVPFEGGVWVLFLKRDGTVRADQEISASEGNFTGQPSIRWGFGVASLGDLDGDGIGDLAVGGSDSSGVFNNHGAIWVLFLNSDGTVKAHQEISQTQGGFTGTLNSGLGLSVACLGDLDGDGVSDLAAGNPGDDDGGSSRGAVWVLFLNTDGTVKANQKISSTQGGFTGSLNDVDLFGRSVAGIGDLDGDGVVDVVVGANLDDDGGTPPFAERGAVWVLLLNSDGTVKTQQKISSTEGAFSGMLDDSDQFGISVASVGDLDGDGHCDVAVGAQGDDDGGPSRGAVWLLFLHADGTVKSHQKISSSQGAFTGDLDNFDRFGNAVASLGDLDGDGVVDLAVGAENDDDDNAAVWGGATWILFLDGFVTIDFETENDSPASLVNGQALSSTSGFGSLLEIDGFPLSGLTAAIFDSSPDGPNALSADPDLLVDRGKVLILQEDPFQTTPGIYDSPDDDRFGGEFLVTFGARTVSMSAVDLIDVCPIPNQDVTLTLIDASARMRTYLVPAGWTGDVAVHGPPGFGRLDLTTLADQPGFVATATAVEDPGFDPESVAMLRIHLDGSAGLDNLVFRRSDTDLSRPSRPRPAGSSPSSSLALNR